MLEKIVAASRRELALRKTAVPAAELERKLDGLPPVRDFRAALTAPGMQVIAELKAASPSKGIIRQPLEVEALAVELERSGAAALSVLTERNYFLGGLENLERARKVVELPLLRKDFIYDEYQILEARAAGADAVLLIAAMLAPAEYFPKRIPPERSRCCSTTALRSSESTRATSPLSLPISASSRS